MAENQTECSRFKQRPAIKFLVAEKCKPYEIYTRMSTEKHVLVKTIFTNGINMGLPQ